MNKQRNKSTFQITDSSIEEYAHKMTTGESEDLKELVESSDRELDFIDMLSGNLVGQLLKIFIKVSGAKRVLEIGTFTGYSAVAMAEALPKDGEILTIEMNLLYQQLAEKHFAEYDTERKIQLIKGNAQDVVIELEGEFDLIFIDADKLSYQHYYENTLPVLKKGGLMVIDNVLWGGTVLNPEEEKAKALDTFNKAITGDERVEQIMLPVRDGVTVIRKK